MAKLKLVHINAHSKYSTGNIATSIINEVGNESKLFYAYGSEEKENTVKHYSRPEWMADVALTRFLGLDSIWSWNNTRKIIRNIKRENPDVVHLHNLHGFYINYRQLFRFIKKNDIRVVWSLHDCWSFTGHCPHFDFVGCERWKTGCHHCPLYKKTYLKSWFFDRSKKGYEIKKRAFCGVKNLVIVTPSKWLEGLVKQSFLKEYPVKVINSGINTENFDIVSNNSFKGILPKDKKIVLAVASTWDQMKGLSDVVEISRRLNDDYVVVMVGVSEAIKKELSNEKIVAITRTENQRQLAELYSAAHVFINTTYEDNYPTVNIEALCCGCPIITYATGGSVESVSDEAGIVVSKGNIDEMMSAIYSLKGKRYNREKISENAKSLFSKEEMVRKYIDVYSGFFN